MLLILSVIILSMVFFFGFVYLFVGFTNFSFHKGEYSDNDRTNINKSFKKGVIIIICASFIGYLLIKFKIII